MIKRIISSILLITVAMCSCVTAFAADVNLSDINSSHWAYEAVAELVSKKTVNGYPDGTFRPNGIVTYAEFEKMITGEWKDNPTPINREAALDMLWSYSGKPENYSAPGIITKQMSNKKAAAWGYATGLMQGNDGINLRPADTLTRAEASTLIVRSTKSVSGDFSFAASASDDVLKLIWDTYDIFDSEYVPTETVTADELWNATKKLGNIKTSDIKVTESTVEDAATLLMYAALFQSGKSTTVSSIDGVTDKYGTIAKIYAAYGYENGIVLPAEASKPATKRDIALILIQTDDLVGRNGIILNKNLAEYPANYKDYPFLEEGVPMAAYATPFDNGAKPVDYYDFVNNFKYVFETFVSEMEKKCGYGVVDFTLIPSLVSENIKSEAILRVKCTLNGKSAYDVFGAGFENAGNEFYMDLHTGEPVMNVFIPTDIAKIGKFVCNQ